MTGFAAKKKSTGCVIVSVISVCAAVLLDQVTKLLAANGLKEAPIELIPEVLELRYLENTSAAFSVDLVSILHKIFHFKYFDAHPASFLTAKMVFLVAFTLVVLVYLCVLYLRIPWNRHFLPLNLIFLGLGSGALGNLIDRVLHRYVIDFIYVKLINFPIFNVADICVTLSAVGLILAVLFVYREEDFAVVFPPKRKGGDT